MTAGTAAAAAAAGEGGSPLQGIRGAGRAAGAAGQQEQQEKQEQEPLTMAGAGRRKGAGVRSRGWCGVLWATPAAAAVRQLLSI